MNRTESLMQIITFDENREQAFSVLSSVSINRALDERLIEVTDSILAGVLQKFISGCICAENLEEWANFVECRDEIDSDKNEGYIYALANPELMGGITVRNISKMLTILES